MSCGSGKKGGGVSGRSRRVWDGVGAAGICVAAKQEGPGAKPCPALSTPRGLGPAPLMHPRCLTLVSNTGRMMMPYLAGLLVKSQQNDMRELCLELPSFARLRVGESLARGPHHHP